MFKNYLKSYGFLLGLIIVLTIIISIMNSLFSKNFSIIKIIIPIISMLASSIYLGRKVKEKAYLEGLKFSTIYIIIITITKLILKQSFNYKIIIIYIALIFSGIIGSMMGINFKSSNK